jgi:transposase-like protein
MACRGKDKPEPGRQQRAAEGLVRRAREENLSLTGPDGLLRHLGIAVLEAALNQEIAEHLGHDKHAPAGNACNGTRPRTVLTEVTLEPMMFSKFVMVVSYE